MKITRVLVTILPILVILNLSLAAAQTLDSGTGVTVTTERSQEVRKGYDDYLRRMGFEDFSGALRESLVQKNFLNKDLSPKVLQFQAKRYEFYNIVRELATDLLLTLHTTNRSPDSRDKLIEFATKLLTIKPIEPPTRLPDRIKNLRGKELETAAWDYAVEVTRQNIENHIQILMSDLIHVTFGQKNTLHALEKLKNGNADPALTAKVETLKKYEVQISALVKFMYLDAGLGSFSVTALGKALVLGMTRYEKLATKMDPNRKVNLISKIKRSLRKSGLYYENYVGTVLKVNSENGIVNVQIKNGDFIHERSIGKEANEITSGARPGGFKNFLYAVRLTLLGSLVGTRLFPEEETGSNRKTLLTLAKDRLAKLSAFQTGVSHVGVAEVLHDPETGTETTRSWDNYPDDSEGGIRITDILHQFAKYSEYMRLVVSRYSPSRFLSYAKEYAQKVGYKEIVWMGDRKKADGELQMDIVPWKSSMTEKEFIELHSAPPSAAASYYEEINRRTIEGMRELFLKGIGFAYGFSNEIGRGYCTFTIFMARLIKTGIDPQPRIDRWNYSVPLLAKMGSAATEGLRVGLRILAPAGFMWQSSLTDPKSIQNVTYPKLSDEERLRTGFSSQEAPMNSDLYHDLKRLPEFVRLSQEGINAKDTVTASEIEEALERNIQKRMKSREGRPATGTSFGSYIDVLSGHVKSLSSEPQPKTTRSCRQLFTGG
jgi:hypothetical protein